jgi:hypothetical protein
LFSTRRNAISDAARVKWPGNTLPNFKLPVMQNELDKVVDELVPNYSTAEVNFSRNGVRQHILDTMNERRRRVRKSVDYTKLVIIVHGCSFHPIPTQTVFHL